MKNIINRFLKPLHVELHGKGYIQALAKGDFKKDEFDFQKKYLSGRKVCIFDIGANVGYMCEKYKGIFPEAIIHAFEPFPDSFQRLKNSISQYKNITINQMAIGLKKQKRIFCKFKGRYQLLIGSTKNWIVFGQTM